MSVNFSNSLYSRATNNPTRLKKKGFTLLELMIVVLIIGVLALASITSYRSFIVRSQLTEMAATLGQFAHEFEIWRQVNGRYPQDSHITLPPDANGLAISQAEWSKTTSLGGNWNWEGPDGYSYAGISIVGSTAPEEEIIQFDTIMDDGDLTSGKFRKTVNGRYTYILNE